MAGFQLQRLGTVMEPELGNPQEIEGVLNPAAVRGPDGELYLFPRLVARGNYSRIGIARVKFNAAGDPVGVERLGIALEPEADYERRPDGSGGCEDPRITFGEDIKGYVMTYTAFSPKAHGSPWHFRRICSTGSVWGLRPSVRIKASNSTASTTKTPRYSPSPFLTQPGNRQWPCCTGRSFPAHAPRKPPATPSPVTWISIGKAFGFLTVHWVRWAMRPITSAILPYMVGWPVRWLPGSGSKSAAALRPS